MRNIIIKILSIIGAVAPVSLMGHIFQATTLQQDNQTIILCSDYHQANQLENRNANVKQQDAIIEFAKKNNALVIVEDAYCSNLHTIARDTSAQVEPLPCKVNEQFIRSSLLSPINYLYTRCHLHDISSVNVETRFSDFRTAAQYMGYLNAKKKNISCYNDSQAFNLLYNNELALIDQIIDKPCTQLISFLTNNNDLLNDTLKRSTIAHIDNLASILKSISEEPWAFDKFAYNDQLSFLFMLYDSRLMELDMLHAIAQHPDQQLIVLIAGATHTKACTRNLSSLGYSTTQFQGQECAMNESRTGFIEPAAIDLQEIFETYSVIQEAIPTSSSIFIDYLVWILTILGYKS